MLACVHKDTRPAGRWETGPDSTKPEMAGPRALRRETLMEFGVGDESLGRPFLSISAVHLAS